jgi:hypothetical protein
MNLKSSNQYHDDRIPLQALKHVQYINYSFLILILIQPL